MIYKTFKEWEEGNYLEDLEPRKEAYTQQELDLIEMGWNYGVDAEQERRTEKYPIAFTHEEYNAVIDAALADGAKTEREACARECEKQANELWLKNCHSEGHGADQCSVAIRARGLK